MKFKGITDDTDGRRGGEKRTGSKKHIMKGKDAPQKYHKTP